MEGCRIFKSLGSVRHLPTWLLIIGYPVYFLEMYVLNANDGMTSPLAWIIFLTISLAVILCSRNQWIAESKELSTGFDALLGTQKVFITISCCLSLFIFFIALDASFLPPYMPQEYDALHYHYTLPRQHLILGSFTHIPWAADDLFLLPIQFALSPFWFSSYLPNKIPQFIFFIGLCLILYSFSMKAMKSTSTRSIVVLLTLFGSHFVGIQLGTAMLDLVICYLFFAALDSFSNKKYVFGTIEAMFFMFSKSFIPLQMVFIGLAMMVIYFIFYKFGFKSEESTGNLWSNKKDAAVVGVTGVIISALIGIPFMVKSLLYSGTPFFPLLAGAFDKSVIVDMYGAHWESLLASSHHFVTQVKSAYGYGISGLDFVKHFWLIAVPDSGVNNRFDYPVGLVYLMVVAPFLALVIKNLKVKRLSLISLFIILYWASWWFSTQQSRFLLIPIFLMVVYVVNRIERVSTIFYAVLCLAITFNAISVFRVHKSSFKKSGYQVMRDKDKEILVMNEVYKSHKQGYVTLEFRDVAFAQFPVWTETEVLPHTILP